MNTIRGVNRRSLMKGVAGGAVAPAALAGTVFAEGAGGAVPDATVAVTVVRATHSATSANELRVGVRASIRSAGFARDGLVLVVEPVTFGVPPAEAGTQIADAVRAQVSGVLEREGIAVDSDRIAVQVFGGVL